MYKRQVWNIGRPPAQESSRRGALLLTRPAALERLAHCGAARASEAGLYLWMDTRPCLLCGRWRLVVPAVGAWGGEARFGKKIPRGGGRAGD